MRASFRAPLLTLMAGVALLLLIVCGNVANLLLARAVVRDGEMSVRLALGASRRRLVRQLLAESAILALGGAILGLLIAWWASRVLLSLSTGAPTNALDVGFDLPVLLFTGAVSIIGVGLFGLAPALRATRLDIAATMRSGARAVGQRAHGNRLPLGKWLIASQVALSLLLLVSAGLLVRSLRGVENTNSGFDRDSLLVADIQPDPRRYGGERWALLGRDVLARINATPGVSAASISVNGLFTGTDDDQYVGVDGFTPRQPSDSLVQYDQVGPGYFRQVGAHIIAGRELAASDDRPAVRVVVINETMARFYFGQPSQAIGKRVRMGSASWLSVVGVVADVMDHGLSSPPVRRLYSSYFNPSDALDFMRVEVRAAGDPGALSRSVREAIAGADPSLRILSVRPLVSVVESSLRQERLLVRLAIAFGAVALGLSALGLYGVMSYTVARRTAEIGLRITLGATPATVLRLVLGEAFALVAIGLVVGLPLALVAGQLLRGQLHGVSGWDPLTVGGAVGVLAVSAICAVLIPAARAARVAPLDALRSE